MRCGSGFEHCLGHCTTQMPYFVVFRTVDRKCIKTQHFGNLFSQTLRADSRDRWSLRNGKVPSAHSTTPPFGPCLARAWKEVTCIVTDQMAGNRRTLRATVLGAGVSTPTASHRIHGLPTGPVRREAQWAVYEMVFQNFLMDEGSKETRLSTLRRIRPLANRPVQKYWNRGRPLVPSAHCLLLPWFTAS